MRIDTLPEDMVGLTLERRPFAVLESFDGPPKPALLEDYVRAELTREEGGTPAFRAWVQRAALRHHLVPT